MSDRSGKDVGSLDEDPLAISAADAVAAYRRLFKRRIQAHAKQTTLAFRNPEPNALLALAEVWQCQLSSSPAVHSEGLDNLIALTRPLFEDAPAHHLAIDIAGVAWVDAYGVLPIRQPPLEQLEWVLESGKESRAISGVIGSAWRVAFLASATGLFDWRHRPVAERELVRRATYLRSKVEALTADQTLEPAAFSLQARVAFVLGLAGRRLADERLLDAAGRQLDGLDLGQDPDSSFRDAEVPSAVVAQIGAANELLDRSEIAERCRRYLLEQRFNEETSLITVGPGGEARDELSPWVMLALMSASAVRVAPQRSGLRRLAVLGRRR
ncbi:MAG: hypothetical protein ACYC91_02635 [Solirubrobacteraceae bacterium]